MHVSITPSSSPHQHRPPPPPSLPTPSRHSHAQAEGYGKQDAERYTRFASYPPVLTVHLKRFEYDFRTDNMCKVPASVIHLIPSHPIPFLPIPSRSNNRPTNQAQNTHTRPPSPLYR
jgi:hypothetical protein